MVRVAVIACIALLSVGCGGGGSDAPDARGRLCEVFGLSPKIINGVTCEDTTRPALVRVGVVLQRGGVRSESYVCTGVVVAPTVVLTAAHCLEPFPRLGFQIVSTFIDIGSVDAPSRVTATSFRLHPNFTRQDGGLRDLNDVAVLRFSTPLPTTTIPVLVSADPPLGARVVVAGYGQTSIGSNPPAEEFDFDELRAGAMTLEGVTADHYFVVFDGRNANPCFGDSGGPLLYEYNGETVVLGIVSEGSRNDCGVGDITSYANLQASSILSFLQQSAAETLFR